MWPVSFEGGLINLNTHQCSLIWYELISTSQPTTSSNKNPCKSLFPTSTSTIWTWRYLLLTCNWHFSDSNTLTRVSLTRPIWHLSLRTHQKDHVLRQVSVRSTFFYTKCDLPGMTTWQMGCAEKAHDFFLLWNIIICCLPKVHIHDGWEISLPSFAINKLEVPQGSGAVIVHLESAQSSKKPPPWCFWQLMSHELLFPYILWQTDLKMNLHSWGNGNRNSPYDWRLIYARRNFSAISKTSRTRIALVQRVMVVPSDRSLSDCSNTTALSPTLFPTIRIWSKLYTRFHVLALVPLSHPKQIQQKGKSTRHPKRSIPRPHGSNANLWFR